MERCAQLFPDCVILNVASVAPPPSKDYHQLYITPDNVIYRSWKISLRSDAKVATPSERHFSFDDFYNDEIAQRDISTVFGDHTVDYVMRVCKGQLDYLPRMSRAVLFHIINYLELEDTAQLSQVSHLFNEICESDQLWESIYRRHSPTPVTHDLVTLAQAIGWKKLFFTNKLQVQVQIRRHRQKTGQHWTPVVHDESDWSSDMQLNSDYDLA